MLFVFLISSKDLLTIVPRQTFTDIKVTRSVREKIIRVIVKEDNSPPLHWSLGGVVKFYLGDDSEVFLVGIKPKESTMDV